MKILRMEGGHRISGTLPVQGAKNSCLPLLAASLLGDGRSVFTNCPVLSDVDTACRILEALGCTVCREGQTITVEWKPGGRLCDSRSADASDAVVDCLFGGGAVPLQTGGADQSGRV